MLLIFDTSTSDSCLLLFLIRQPTHLFSTQMAIFAICIFWGKQLWSACRQTRHKRRLPLSVTMRRPQLYVGILLILLAFWIGGLLTRIDDEAVLGRRSQVLSTDADDEEFDTDFEVFEGVAVDNVEVADEHGPRWEEVQAQVEDALSDMERTGGHLNEQRGKQTLRVVYTPIAEAEEGGGDVRRSPAPPLPTKAIRATTPAPIKEEEEEEIDTDYADPLEDLDDGEAAAEDEEENEEELVEKVEMPVKRVQPQPEDISRYDGRYENPPLDLIQHFTDVPEMESRLDKFNLVSNLAKNCQLDS